MENSQEIKVNNINYHINKQEYDLLNDFIKQREQYIWRYGFLSNKNIPYEVFKDINKDLSQQEIEEKYKQYLLE